MPPEQHTHYHEPIAVERPYAAPVLRMIQFALEVVEVLLAVRLALNAFGANPRASSVTGIPSSAPPLRAGASFTRLIFTLTEPLVAPFGNVLTSTTINGVAIEWTTVLAMAVYALIAYTVMRFIGE
ncbi:MAG: YggT family protein [bacterium]|nr:YggT family protein [bacterium]MDZ4295834.1 YggT family protein [Patescibacteria group bacterium]